MNDSKIKYVTCPADAFVVHNVEFSNSKWRCDLAVIHGIVGKSGAWFDYKEGKIGQGREATKVYLKENPKVLAEIDKAVREKVAAEEV